MNRIRTPEPERLKEGISTMIMRKTQVLTMGLATAVFAAFLALPLRAANENIDYVGLAKIKAEGMQNSQVMNLASWMTDVYGPNPSAKIVGRPTIRLCSLSAKACVCCPSRLPTW